MSEQEQQKQHDLEETREEMSARRIDAASELFAKRAALFIKTLRVNGAGLTPYKRQMTSGWLKLYCEKLQTALAKDDSIPPLALIELPDDLEG